MDLFHYFGLHLIIWLEITSVRTNRVLVTRLVGLLIALVSLATAFTSLSGLTTLVMHFTVFLPVGWPACNNVANCIIRVARVKRLTLSAVGKLTSTIRRVMSLLTTTSFVITHIASSKI